MADLSGIVEAPGVAFSDTATRSFATNIITNDFLPILADARNNSTVLWNTIKDATGFTISGRFCLWPLHVNRNTGHGSGRPGGQLSDPTSEGYRTYTSETRTKDARIKVEGEILRRARTNGGAFIEAVTTEMDSMMDNIAVSMNREIHGDGSGRLGMVRATSNSAGGTIDVKWNSDIEGAASLMSGATALLGKPTMYLEVGDRVAFMTSSGTLRALSSGENQNGFYVLSITSTTITVEATLGSGTAVATNAGWGTAPTAGDWIVRAKSEIVTNSKSTGHMAEMMGYGGILSDADVYDGNGRGGSQQSGSNNYTADANNAGFQGIASSGNTFNQGIVLDNGGSGLRPLTEALMQQSLSDAEEINNAEVDMIVMPYGTYNSYVKLLVPDKRFNNTTDLKGGHRTLDFNGIGIVKDRYCLPGRVMFLATGNVRRFTVQPLQPLAYEGVNTWERLDNYDAYWTGWVVSENIGSLVRNKAGALLTELSA